VITEPGLYFRLPYPFHQPQRIDTRITLLQPKPSEYLTADKKNLILENAVCYRIDNPVLFMETVRDKRGLEVRLTDLLSSHTGLLLGTKELSDIVNVDPKKIKFREINAQLSSLMQRDGQPLGVEVEQVFIKRIMLPYENTIAVYNRMRAERNRIAQKYLAEGEELALKIKAEADKTARTSLATAQKQATIIKGKAEAEAMKIYGNSYRKNLEFYRFLRSLQAYEKIFSNKSVIVLSEKSPILKTLFSGGKNEKN
jgi:membrane protease subunit HflC